MPYYVLQSKGVSRIFWSVYFFEAANLERGRSAGDPVDGVEVTVYDGPFTERKTADEVRNGCEAVAEVMEEGDGQ